MPQIVFTAADGSVKPVTVPVGYTLMEAAQDNGIAGMLAECGGACACATCHGYVDPAWVDRLPAVSDMEDTMLDSVADRRSNSRLCCQIEMTEALDGLAVTIADNGA